MEIGEVGTRDKRVCVGEVHLLGLKFDIIRILILC